jgi:hypothetical protein
MPTAGNAISKRVWGGPIGKGPSLVNRMKVLAGERALRPSPPGQQISAKCIWSDSIRPAVWTGNSRQHFASVRPVVYISLKLQKCGGWQRSGQDVKQHHATVAGAGPLSGCRVATTVGRGGACLPGGIPDQGEIVAARVWQAPGVEKECEERVAGPEALLQGRRRPPCERLLLAGGGGGGGEAAAGRTPGGRRWQHLPSASNSCHKEQTEMT